MPRPLRVISKKDLFEKVGYNPHKGQQRIHKSEARHRCASCGRRFGKSKAGGHELYPCLVAAHAERGMLRSSGIQRRYWIVGPNYDDCEREWRVFYDLCKRRQVPVDRPGTYNDTVGGNMRLSAFDSRFVVECRSAAHPESLDGEGLSGVLMVEAAKMKPLIFNKFILPALADFRGWSLHTSTPEGKNHFYELWQKGQDPAEEEWDSWRMPSWFNDVIFPGGIKDPEIKSLARNMSEERFKQEIAADFTDFVGRVFKAFEEETHVGDFAYRADLPLFGAVDYGWTNPFVWLDIQVDVWDNVYVIGEYYVQQQDINDVARHLRATGRGNARKFFPDPAEPGDSVVLSKYLRVPFAADTGGELKHRLELIRQHLKLVPDHIPYEQRKPKLFISRNCPELIREMHDYRFPETKSETRSAPEEPMDKDNHGPEALGRFFRGYFGPPSSGGTVRVTTADVRTGRPGTRRRPSNVGYHKQTR